MPNKFSIGDRVIIINRNQRTPKFILANLRLDHPRTIIYAFYDKKCQHTRYYLGSNNRGKNDMSGIFFRSTELRKWRKGNIGRPRTKRKYKRHPVKQQGVLNTV